MEAPDFYEGVRALLVDKDNRPTWQPSRVEDVLPISTAKYFNRLADPADEISF
jgi:enoyl-CoA hydratase